MESPARRLYRIWTKSCELDQESGCLPEQCVLFSLLALTIWVGMFSGLLAFRGALSAGMIAAIDAPQAETRTDHSAHRENHRDIHGLAKQWRFSRETVRQMIKDDPGVIKIRFGFRKKHTTYRIPDSAASRIHTSFGGLESAFDEQHYTIGDLSKLWKLGRETLRLVVKDEPGVMKVCLGRKKSHTTYSVPDSVAKRIHNRLLCPA